MFNGYKDWVGMLRFRRSFSQQCECTVIELDTGKLLQC